MGRERPGGLQRPGSRGLKSGARESFSTRLQLAERRGVGRRMTGLASQMPAGGGPMQRFGGEVWGFSRCTAGPTEVRFRVLDRVTCVSFTPRAKAGGEAARDGSPYEKERQWPGAPIRLA